MMEENISVNKPKVSIIIPVYNCENYLSEAIESCLNQSYTNIEVVVVDDGSTDRSLKVAEKYKERITLISSLHQNAACARNIGLRNSDGSYVSFLDADDVLVPTKIARQVECLELQNVDFVYGDWCRISKSTANIKEVIKLHQFDDLVRVTLEDRFPEESIIVGCGLYRRDLINRVGGWDESIDVQDDRMFHFKIALANPKFFHQPGVVVFYRTEHQYSLSSKYQLSEKDYVDSFRSIHRVIDGMFESLKQSNRSSSVYWRALRVKYEEMKDAWEGKSEADQNKAGQRIAELHQILSGDTPK